MIIDLRQLVGGSAELRGTAPEDIFDLPESDEVKVAAPHDYDLRVVDEDGFLLVNGLLQGHFEMSCARCLERFQHDVVIPGYLHSEPTEGRSTIDLTNRIREDILIALPAHPRCDQHGGRSKCPAADLLDSRESPEKPDGDPGIWDALEDWKPE